MTKIFLTSVFFSLDGEVSMHDGQGMLAVFVRFAGCNLRCFKSTGGCDTTYSYQQKKSYSIDTVIEMVEKYSKGICKRVTITGGEPFFQLEALQLLVTELLKKGYYINIETNGSYVVSELSISSWNVFPYFDPFTRICFVVDYKLPGTEMEDRMKVENFSLLRETDWIKFVISNREDYDRAKQIIKQYHTRARIAFSPKFNSIESRTIAEWMKQDMLINVKLQNQMHKIWWPELATSADVGSEV